MARVAKSGGKWIRPVKRRAIYIRDGYRCAYCGKRKPMKALCLDHVTPHGHGGNNDNSSRNLITACISCNSLKGRRTLAQFLRHMEKVGMDRVAARDWVEHQTAIDLEPLMEQAHRALKRQRNG